MKHPEVSALFSELLEKNFNPGKRAYIHLPKATYKL